MTPAELKRRVQATGSHHFDRDTMRHWGDTMKNYRVSGPEDVIEAGGASVKCWKLYRRWPVRGGLWAPAYFACDTYRRVFPIPA
jgi:hypothetical protein